MRLGEHQIERIRTLWSQGEKVCVICATVGVSAGVVAKYTRDMRRRLGPKIHYGLLENLLRFYPVPVVAAIFDVKPISIHVAIHRMKKRPTLCRQ